MGCVILVTDRTVFSFCLFMTPAMTKSESRMGIRLSCRLPEGTNGSWLGVVVHESVQYGRAKERGQPHVVTNPFRF